MRALLVGIVVGLVILTGCGGGGTANNAGPAASATATHVVQGSVTLHAHVLNLGGGKTKCVGFKDGDIPARYRGIVTASNQDYDLPRAEVVVRDASGTIIANTNLRSTATVTHPFTPKVGCTFTFTLSVPDSS